MHKQQISEVVGCNRSVSILQPQDRQEKGMLAHASAASVQSGGHYCSKLPSETMHF